MLWRHYTVFFAETGEARAKIFRTGTLDGIDCCAQDKHFDETSRKRKMNEKVSYMQVHFRNIFLNTHLETRLYFSVAIMSAIVSCFLDNPLQAPGKLGFEHLFKILPRVLF
jgi:hypothetical protein